MSRTDGVIRLGSRGSKLALWQAEFIQSEVARRTGRPVEIVRIKTTGDMILDVPLARVGGKGGGAPDAAQGSGPDAAALEAALAAAGAAVRG